MSEIRFQKLTPNRDVELGDYEKAFDFVFNETDISNVAVSGAYSSGKSSLLESYEKKHIDHKFMHISLAHFEDDSTDRNDELDSEGVIEGKILNQLIQQIPSENIPLTNFRIKKRNKNGVGARVTILSGLFLLTLILCMKYWNLNSFITEFSVLWVKKALSVVLMPELRVLYGAIALGILLYGIYACISVQQKRSIFKRLNIQGNEIEIFEENKEAYFDKYLNEVLYLFENSGVDAIVFEDIDRFENVKVFERLREINILTNIRLKSSDKRIKFFYLLRDDIFQTKDRTKFFDFIVPVVPVLDSSNSYNKIKEYLESTSIYQKFDDYFLRGLSLYIDDLRLLKNIFNEFLIYHSKLSNIELDVNKLFAILTYKNLFPRDFAELQLNRGFVYCLFNSKESLIEEHTQDLLKKRDNLQKLIEQRTNENLHAEYELVVIQSSGYRPTWSNYFKNSSEYNKWNNGLSERIEKLRDPEYKLEKLKDDIAKVDAQIETIQSLSLCQLLDREHITNAFRLVYTDENGNERDFSEIKGNPYFDMLKYLLSRGFIDETYSDYMSYFYDNSLTVNDKNFLRSVTDRIGKDADYSLDNCQLVLENLNEHDFTEPETRNYDLISYVLSSPHVRHEQAKAIANFFESLNVDDIENAFNFIKGYLHKERHLPEFVSALLHDYPSALSDAIEYEQMGCLQLRSFALFCLAYCDEKDQSKAWNDIAVEYVSDNAQIIELDNALFDNVKTTIINTLKSIGVVFKSLSGASDPVLLRGIYENNLYLLNERNVRLLIDKYFGEHNTEIFGAFGDFIAAHADESITQYVLANKLEFSRTYLEFHKGGIYDCSKSIVMFLNDSEINTEVKKQYILRLENKIDVLADISSSELWGLLLIENRVAYSIENVLTHFKKYKLDSSLVEFLNINPEELHYKEYADVSSATNFGISVLKCNELNTDKYRQIVSEIVAPLNSFTVEGLASDKIKLLIELQIIEMSKQNLDFIRSNYADEVMIYIYSDMEEYLNLIGSYDYRLDEVEAILSDAEVSFESKKKLLETIDVSISVLNKPYDDELIVLVLEKYLEPRELHEYLKNYDCFGVSIRKELIKVFAKHIDEIGEYKEDVSDVLLCDIIESAELTEDVKEAFFSVFIDVLSDDLLKSFLLSLHEHKIVGNLFNDDNSHVEVNEKNDRIIEVLNDANRIISPEKMSDTRYKKLRLKRKDQNQ